MRKFFAYCLALIIVVCCFTAAASAAAGPRFTIEDAAAARGERVKLVVNISENRGISAAMLFLTVPETANGDPVFTINKMKQGEWSEGNQAVSREDMGIYNWAYLYENYTESGEFAVFTVTVDPDAEPGDYVMELTIDDIQHNTGKRDERGLEIFEEYDSQKTTAVLTVTDEKVPEGSGSAVIVPGDKNEGEVDIPNTGNKEPADEKSEEPGSSDDRSGSENTDSSTDSSSGKAGATISSSGKTIVSSATTGSSSDTSSESGKKDSTAKTGFFEGQHFYLMICLVALACIIPVAYQVKKRIAKS